MNLSVLGRGKNIGVGLAKGAGTRKRGNRGAQRLSGMWLNGCVRGIRGKFVIRGRRREQKTKKKDSGRGV